MGVTSIYLHPLPMLDVKRIWILMSGCPFVKEIVSSWQREEVSLTLRYSATPVAWLLATEIKVRQSRLCTIKKGPSARPFRKLCWSTGDSSETISHLSLQQRHLLLQLLVDLHFKGYKRKAGAGRGGGEIF